MACDISTASNLGLAYMRDYIIVEPCLEATDVHGNAGTEKRWRFMETMPVVDASVGSAC